MDKKIIIKGLPLNIEETDIEKIFSRAGHISRATIVKDKLSGKPIGVGFIEMPAGDAERAVELFNGTKVGGNTITVSDAHPIEIPQG